MRHVNENFTVYRLLSHWRVSSVLWIGAVFSHPMIGSQSIFASGIRTILLALDGGAVTSNCVNGICPLPTINGSPAKCFWVEEHVGRQSMLVIDFGVRDGLGECRLASSACASLDFSVMTCQHS
jgi:hypothetical protein